MVKDFEKEVFSEVRQDLADYFEKASERYTSRYAGQYLAMRSSCNWSIRGKITKVRVYQTSPSKSSDVLTNLEIFYIRKKDNKECSARISRWGWSDFYILDDEDSLKLLIEIKALND